MGARLLYAKVIDRLVFLNRGAKVHPGLDNLVLLLGENRRAGAFLVLRAWTDDHGSFTEQWRLEAPGGLLVYESTPRELHLATPEHVERLEDEIADLEFDYDSDTYNAVFLLDDIEVARATFPVKAQQ